MLETVEWVNAMQSSDRTNKERHDLGRKALKALSGYMDEVVSGQGIDRHLLGLLKCLKPGETRPALYTDPSYAESCHWYLSTSQIPSEYYDGWGWGEVVPDGFGIAYLIKNNSIHYNIAALKGKLYVICNTGGPGRENGPGSWRGKGKGLDKPCEKMRHYLQESLEDMKAVFDSQLDIPKPENNTKAKL
jgi:hypothetical protein